MIDDVDSINSFNKNVYFNNFIKNFENFKQEKYIKIIITLRIEIE
jgi:hypothetical protein